MISRGKFFEIHSINDMIYVEITYLERDTLRKGAATSSRWTYPWSECKELIAIENLSDAALKKLSLFSVG